MWYSKYMHEINRGPDSIDINAKYNRRAKLATITASLGLLGAAMFEATDARPASAHSEMTERVEQSPQALINSVDEKLVKLETELRAARGIKIIDDHKDKTVNAPAGVYTYYLAESSSTKADRYDILAMIVKKGDKAPLATVLSLGATSKRYGDTNAQADSIMIMNQAVNPQNSFTPGTIELSMGSALDNSFVKYCVATSNYDGNHPKFGKTLDTAFKPVSSTAVSKQINAFFNQANVIVEAGK